MDDEVTVRQLAQTTLQNYGYRVVTATSGLDGITIFEQYKEEIKILVSDTDRQRQKFAHLSCRHQNGHQRVRQSSRGQK